MKFDLSQSIILASDLEICSLHHIALSLSGNLNCPSSVSLASVEKLNSQS